MANTLNIFRRFIWFAGITLIASLVITSVVSIFDYLSDDSLFQRRKKIIEKCFFYYNSSNCIQRAQLVGDLKLFEDYCNWYILNDFSYSDGVKLLVLNSISINPYNEVYIYDIDTLDNGFVYASAFQHVYRGKKLVEVHGFVQYGNKKSNPPKNDMAFCDMYLDVPWANVYGEGSSPDPRYQKSQLERD